MLSRTIAVALSLHLVLQAHSPAATSNTGKNISVQKTSQSLQEHRSLLKDAQALKKFAITWIQNSSDQEFKQQFEKMKSWPTVEVSGALITFQMNNEKVHLEILDLETKHAQINGRDFYFDSSQSLSSQIQLIQKQIFTPRRGVIAQLLLPEAQAFVPALAFLSANAWGPLMVGIAMSGVFADFALRPAIENGVSSACETVAHSPVLVNLIGGLNREGVCRNYFRAQAANSCLSPDKTVLEYTLQNADQTFTKWVASLDAGGKVTGIKELLLDPDQRNVLRTPIEYRMRNEDLAEVKLTPMISLKPSNLRVSQTEQWASYQVVASLMRTAASMCQPGKYDELFRAAQSRRAPDVERIPLRQSSRQFLNKAGWSGT